MTNFPTDKFISQKASNVNHNLRSHPRFGVLLAFKRAKPSVCVVSNDKQGSIWIFRAEWELARSFCRISLAASSQVYRTNEPGLLSCIHVWYWFFARPNRPIQFGPPNRDWPKTCFKIIFCAFTLTWSMVYFSCKFGQLLRFVGILLYRFKMVTVLWVLFAVIGI